MTYIGDVIKTQMQKMQVTKDMILANTIVDEDDLEMLIKNKLPAELILYQDIQSLCNYLQMTA